MTPAQLALWANEVQRDCLLEAGEDVESGLAAAEYIVANFSTDAEGHEHRGKGKGGGQFTSTSSGGAPAPKKKAAPGSKSGKQPKKSADPAAQYKEMGTRAPAFLAWFGDWEGDPENASKVVNRETGEPQETHGTAKKVFHGRLATFDEFEKGAPSVVGSGFYFAEDHRIARQWTRSGGKETGNVVEAYLSIKKPLDFDDSLADEEIARLAEALDGMEGGLGSAFATEIEMYNERDSGSAEDFKRNRGKLVWDVLSGTLGKGRVNDFLAEVGYDGLAHLSQDEYGTPNENYRGARQPRYGRCWIAFDNKQIKATSNTGTFDPASANIYLAHDISNRRAQGVLDRALRAAKNLTSEARADLESALSAGPSASGPAILTFIDKYRVQLARLLTTTQLAAVLEGAREVAGKVPQLDRDASAVEALVGKIPQPSFPVSRDDPHFPTIDEAARSLAKKNVLSRPGYDTLDAAARAKAFTVAGVDATETLTKIRDVMADNVEKGADYATFRKEVLDAVDEGTFLSPGHVENIFRTNVQTAFSDGQASVLSNPLVRSAFPYVARDAIHDDRVRHNHLALEKLGIQGTNVYRVDDPVWQLFRAPWDYNDRCSDTFMTVQQAAEAGIEEAREWERTGIEPADPAFVAMPPFQPPPGFQRSLAGAPLSIRLSMQPMASFSQPAPAPSAILSIDADSYPRDAANRFIPPLTITEAARDPLCAAELRDSLPEGERFKLDRLVSILQAGGTVHHPKEPPGLAVNIDGVVADPRWAAYAEALAAREMWEEREAGRKERRSAADSFTRDVRQGSTAKLSRSLESIRDRGMDLTVTEARDECADVTEECLSRLDGLNRRLRESGAADPEVRDALRLRRRLEVRLADRVEAYVSQLKRARRESAPPVEQERLDDRMDDLARAFSEARSEADELYEEIAEAIYRRVEAESLADPEPDIPEEPEESSVVPGGAAFAQWITIGGHKEGDKKHVGGFRVLIDGDGVIQNQVVDENGVTRKGKLHGVNVRDVKAHFDKKRAEGKGKQAGSAEDQPAAPGAAGGIGQHQRKIAAAMKSLIPPKNIMGLETPVDIPELRAKSGLSKEEFDRAVLDMARNKRFSLARAQGAVDLAYGEALVDDGEGNKFIRISARHDAEWPQEQESPIPTKEHEKKQTPPLPTPSDPKKSSPKTPNDPASTMTDEALDAYRGTILDRMKEARARGDVDEFDRLRGEDNKMSAEMHRRERDKNKKPRSKKTAEQQQAEEKEKRIKEVADDLASKHTAHGLLGLLSPDEQYKITSNKSLPLERKANQEAVKRLAARAVAEKRLA